MSEELPENELSLWFSTYGLITAERILGKYQIKLAHDDLLIALKNPFSFYHRLLEIPLKNVLNGIVFQQANDYHIYAQKLFIDYLLSPECSKEEGAQGASTRESLEDERQQLVTLGDEYHKKRNEHDTLIANSQAILIKITREFNAALEMAIGLVSGTLRNAGFDSKKSDIRKAINHALVQTNLTNSQYENNKYLFIDKMNEHFKVTLDSKLKEKLVNNLEEIMEILLSFDAKVRQYLDEAHDISQQSNSFRTQFHQSIIRILELMSLLPEYKINPEQDAINREPLYFDNSIGAFH